MSRFMIRGELRLKNARLVRAREEVRMTQKAFAEHLGITYHSYNGYETMRKYPSPKHRRILASFCVCSEEELFPLELVKYAEDEEPRILIQVAEIEPSRLIGRIKKQALLVPASETADGDCEKQELLEQINLAFNKLKPEEVLAIKLYYGLDGYEEHTLAEAGVVMGITPERVRQRKLVGLEKLRFGDASGSLGQFWKTVGSQ